MQANVEWFIKKTAPIQLLMGDRPVMTMLKTSQYGCLGIGY